MMKKHKRKVLNISIKKEFQRWLLIRIAGAVLVSGLVAAIILYFYSRQELGESFYTAHITVRRVSDLLLPVILAGSAVSLISGICLALFLPQKIAGPLYHVEQDLERVGQGDLTVHINLRKEDTLKDFVAVVNMNIETLRDSIKEIQTGLNDLDHTTLSPSQQQAINNLAKFKV